MTKIRQAWCIVAVLLLLIGLGPGLLTGCQTRQTAFPALSPGETRQTNDTDGSVKESAEQEGISHPVRLSLAVPFDDTTAEALRLLFLARESGLMAVDRDRYIGHQVSLDDLRQFDAPLTFEVIQVSAAGGITGDQMRTWLAAASLPDLLYCRAAAETPGLDRLLTLDSLLYDHDLLSPASVYTMAVDVLRRGQALYGVPYLASVPVIYHDRSLLEQLQLSVPPLYWTWAEWSRWMAETQQKLTTTGLGATPEILTELAEDPEAVQGVLDRAVFIYRDLTDFIPFVAPSLSATAGWGMWNGYAFDLDTPVFRTAAAWLRQQAQSGYALNHLTESQLETVLSGNDNAFNGRVICRVVDSSELPATSQAGEAPVLLSFMPAGSLSVPDSRGSAAVETLPVRLPVQIRSLVVNRETEQPELAARLAAFIALDPDALLLQNRFVRYDGLFPLVRDAFVWQSVVAGQAHGSQLQSIRTYLTDAYSGGQQMVASWEQIMQTALKQDAGVYLTAGPADDLEQAFSQIMATASQILYEGGF